MRKKIIIALVLSIFLLTGCSDADTDETIDIKVISYGGNFRGAYILDGRKTTTFTGSNLGNDCYSFENTVEIEDQLEIEADAIYDEDGENELTSLEIKIYLDGEMVKNIEDTASVSKISLTYTTGESDNSDS